MKTLPGGSPTDAQAAGPAGHIGSGAAEAPGNLIATALASPHGTLLPPRSWFERCARLSALPLPLAQSALIFEPCDGPGDGSPPPQELAPWHLRIDAGRLGEAAVRLGEPLLAGVGSMLGPAFAPGSQTPALAAALLEFGAAPGLDAVDAALQLGGRLTLCSLEPLPPEVPHDGAQPLDRFWLPLRPRGRPEGVGTVSVSASKAWLGLTPAQWDAVFAAWPATATPPSAPPPLPLDRVIGHTGLQVGVLRDLASGDWIVIDEPVAHETPAGSEALAPCPGCLLVCGSQTLGRAQATPAAWVLAHALPAEAAARAEPHGPARPDIEARAWPASSPPLQGPPDMTFPPDDTAEAGHAGSDRIDTDTLPVRIEFRLPVLTSTVAEIGRWRPGDVLGPLVASDLDDIALYVGPHCIGKGRLLKLDGDWGVQLTELRTGLDS